MSKKDFIFFLSFPKSNRLSLAFCKSENNTKKSSKEKISQVLSSKKIASYELNYLGELDYKNMDQEIVNQLHHFEKQGEVWLLLNTEE